MSEPDPLDTPATAARLRALHRRDALDDDRLHTLLDAAAHGPSGAEWAGLLDRALLAIGAGLCVAAVIYFFAGNWADLPDAAKLGAAMAAVAGAAGWALYAPERRSGRVALTAAAGLTGALLAVYGQIYQTGADAWTLFAAWSALLVPWVLASRDEPLITLWLVVGTLALALGMDQGALRVRDESLRILVIAGPAAAAWLVCELLPEPRRPARWFVRTAGTAVFAALTCVGFILTLDGFDGGDAGAWPALLPGLGIGAWVLGLGRKRPIDLYLASIVWLSAIIILTTLWGRVLFDGFDAGELGVLLIALAVIGEVGVAAAWLRRAWQRGAR